MSITGLNSLSYTVGKSKRWLTIIILLKRMNFFAYKNILGSFKLIYSNWTFIF